MFVAGTDNKYRKMVVKAFFTLACLIYSGSSISPRIKYMRQGNCKVKYKDSSPTEGIVATTRDLAVQEE